MGCHFGGIGSIVGDAQGPHEPRAEGHQQALGEVAEIMVVDALFACAVALTGAMQPSEQVLHHATRNAPCAVTMVSLDAI